MTPPSFGRGSSSTEPGVATEMRWSRLKSQVEARFAPSLFGRVAVHQARYRHAREEVGRVWLSVDGREAASL